MKKYIIIIITAGLINSVVGLSSHSYEFTVHQTEIIESYSDEKEFSTCEEGLNNYGQEIVLKQTPAKLSTIKEPRIWKPPVNS
ncbi:MAG: hypothetical protein AB1394_02795 [Bacteroidota bacterium]